MTPKVCSRRPAAFDDRKRGAAGASGGEGSLRKHRGIQGDSRSGFEPAEANAIRDGGISIGSRFWPLGFQNRGAPCSSQMWAACPNPGVLEGYDLMYTSSVEPAARTRLGE